MRVGQGEHGKPCPFLVGFRSKYRPIDRYTPMAYSMSGRRVIVETSVFTKQVLDLLSDKEYRKFQIALAKRPNVGAMIEGSGGLRKVR